MTPAEVQAVLAIVTARLERRATEFDDTADYADIASILWLEATLMGRPKLPTHSPPVPPATSQ